MTVLARFSGLPVSLAVINDEFKQIVDLDFCLVSDLPADNDLDNFSDGFDGESTVSPNILLI